MKKNALKKMAAVIGIAGIMTLNLYLPVMAYAPPKIERTRAWDDVEHTLGGIPESVTKMEYKECVFYLGEGVTEEDFIAVINAGPEAVSMQTYNNSKLYNYPAYILWNTDKTVLLVHPIIFASDNILESVAISAELPETLTGGITSELTSISVETMPEKINVTPLPNMTKEQTVEYMLSDEYTDAVREEFYRLLNEHRVSNGLRELEVNLELQEYADLRAAEQRILFGHTRPDKSPAGSGWHDSQNFMNTRYAENATNTGSFSADAQNTAIGIFTGWKDSSGHNEHMLYDFDPQITMALGIYPEFDEYGLISSGAIFASGV